jgi:hypothetical protein
VVFVTSRGRRQRTSTAATQPSAARSSRSERDNCDKQNAAPLRSRLCDHALVSGRRRRAEARACRA